MLNGSLPCLIIRSPYEGDIILGLECEGDSLETDDEGREGVEGVAFDVAIEERTIVETLEFAAELLLDNLKVR